MNIVCEKDITDNLMAILCDAFMVRCHDFDQDPLWKLFYETQLDMYLHYKKRCTLSNPEGDMIHDLIRTTWEELRDEMENSIFEIVNPRQWFSTIHIDFPLSPENLRIESF